MSLTLESARAEMAELRTGTRDGWLDLPGGGSVLIENGHPFWISDAGNGALVLDDVVREAREITGISFEPAAGAWFWSRDTSDGLIRDERLCKVVPNVTIESAREGAQALLRGTRYGWLLMPVGAVFIQYGRVMRLSERGQCGSTLDVVYAARVRWCAEQITGQILTLEAWDKRTERGWWIANVLHAEVP